MYNSNSNYECNYDFVPFNEPHYYKKFNDDNLTGYAELKFITQGKLYIGSGFSDETQGTFVLQTIKDYDNKPIIPASSLKGAVRNVCSAVSDGCLPIDKRNQYSMPYSDKIKCSTDNGKHCIVCDMFGMIGKGGNLASKVSFIDFKPVKYSLDIDLVNQQYSPNSKNSKYKNGSKFKGYKFYYTDCNIKKSQNLIKVEYVEKYSEFIGKVFFKNLTTDELQLLLFACGADGYINLKIGGFKNDGFGEVACYCKDLVINNEHQADPFKWAEDYQKGYGKKFKSNIEKLGDILYPSNEN